MSIPHQNVSITNYEHIMCFNDMKPNCSTAVKNKEDLSIWMHHHHGNNNVQEGNNIHDYIILLFNCHRIGFIQSLDWTSGLDWWTGLSFFFVFFILAHIWATGCSFATLNVKYAGESVYLALSVILELCAILSLGIMSIVRLLFVLS